MWETITLILNKEDIPFQKYKKKGESSEHVRGTYKRFSKPISFKNLDVARTDKFSCFSVVAHKALKYLKSTRYVIWLNRTW